jgi:hypothetical protein
VGLLIPVMAAVLVACGSGAASSPPTHMPDRTPTTIRTPVSPPYAHITPEPFTPRPIYTPVPLPAMTSALDGCLTSAPDDPTAAASSVQRCLAERSIGVDTLAVEGTLPIVFVEQEQAPCFYDSFIVSLESGTWRARDVSALFPHGDAIRLIAVTPEFRARFGKLAIETGSGDDFRLIDLVGFAVCGSGPRILPAIFALHNDTWSFVWLPWGTLPPAGPPTGMMVLSDTGTRLTSASGDVVVTGSAWGNDLPGQPAGAGTVFFEAHPGPHRTVDQTWKRQGDSYVFVSEKVEPSAYNTLLNFVADISAGNERAAAALTTDPALVSTARALGLAQNPIGQQWGIDFLAPSMECCGPLTIGGRTAYTKGPPQPVKVTFVQRDGNWLITSFTQEPPEPTPTVAPPSPPRAG